MANRSLQDLIHWRLDNQRLARATFKTPGEVVAWLGAVQAQDYLGSLWAVGLRMQTATAAAIEQAIADRTIVRTWPMRGTLHFVAPADVRWMLHLLAPRIASRHANYMLQQYDVDGATLARSQKVVLKALHGGRQVTRTTLYQLLEAAHISTAQQRGLHILGWLAQTGVICCGPRAGKQPTFVSLDEWVPASKTLDRDEALAELARRYLTSHGPATVADFAWWSGLTVIEARTAFELVKPEFISETSADQVYWFSQQTPVTRDDSTAAYLLPAYDEYSVAYKDRSLLLGRLPSRAIPPSNVLLGQTIVVDGRVVGTWRRALQKDALRVTPKFFVKLTKAEVRAFTTAAERYGAFLGRAVVIADE